MSPRSGILRGVRGNALSVEPSGKRLARGMKARAMVRPLRRRPLLWCSSRRSGRVRRGNTIAKAKSWPHFARLFCSGASRDRFVWLPTDTCTHADGSV